MAKPFSTMENSNPGTRPHLRDLMPPSRRSVLQMSMGLASAALFGPWVRRLRHGQSGRRSDRMRPGFKSVPVDIGDRVTVAQGYSATALAPWGEPVGLPGAMPAWKPDASNTAADQAQQMGMHHDGIHYLALDGSRRGLLVMNHEYVDDGLLHADGMKTWTAEKVLREKARRGPGVSG